MEKIIIEIENLRTVDLVAPVFSPDYDEAKGIIIRPFGCNHTEIKELALNFYLSEIQCTAGNTAVKKVRIEWKAGAKEIRNLTQLLSTRQFTVGGNPKLNLPITRTTILFIEVAAGKRVELILTFIEKLVQS